MTSKRDSKSKPKTDRPKIKKETLKDLEAKDGEKVKAGRDLSGYEKCSL